MPRLTPYDSTNHPNLGNRGLTSSSMAVVKLDAQVILAIMVKGLQVGAHPAEHASIFRELCESKWNVPHRVEKYG